MATSKTINNRITCFFFLSFFFCSKAERKVEMYGEKIEARKKMSVQFYKWK